jgi:hypothetical protein
VRIDIDDPRAIDTRIILDGVEAPNVCEADSRQGYCVIVTRNLNAAGDGLEKIRVFGRVGIFIARR